MVNAFLLFMMIDHPPRFTLFPYTTLFRSATTRAASPMPWWCWTSTPRPTMTRSRSEEHTSELQSRGHLVCRLLLEKKKVPCDEDLHWGHRGDCDCVIFRNELVNHEQFVHP